MHTPLELDFYPAAASSLLIGCAPVIPSLSGVPVPSAGHAPVDSNHGGASTLAPPSSTGVTVVLGQSTPHSALFAFGPFASLVLPLTVYVPCTRLSRAAGTCCRRSEGCRWE